MHSENGLSNTFTFSGITIFLNAVLSKESSSISVNEAEKLIVVRLSQPLKACSLICVTFSLRTTLVKDLQFLKALVEMVRIPDGIVMLLNASIP